MRYLCNAMMCGVYACTWDMSMRYTFKGRAIAPLSPSPQPLSHKRKGGMCMHKHKKSPLEHTSYEGAKRHRGRGACTAPPPQPPAIRV